MSLPHDAEGENKVVFKNAYISPSRAVEALVHLTKGSLTAERSQDVVLARYISGRRRDNGDTTTETSRCPTWSDIAFQQ